MKHPWASQKAMISAKKMYEHMLEPGDAPPSPRQLLTLAQWIDQERAKQKNSINRLDLDTIAG